MAEEGVLPAPPAEAPDPFIEIANLVDHLREEGHHQAHEAALHVVVVNARAQELEQANAALQEARQEAEQRAANAAAAQHRAPGGDPDPGFEGSDNDGPDGRGGQRRADGGRRWVKPIPTSDFPPFPGRSYLRQHAYFERLEDAKVMYRCTGSHVVNSAVRTFNTSEYTWWSTHGRDYYQHLKDGGTRSLTAFRRAVEREYSDHAGPEEARMRLYSLRQGADHRVSQYKGYFDLIVAQLPPEDRQNTGH